MVATELPEGQKPAQDSADHANNDEKGPWWLFWQKDRVAGFTAWIAIFTTIIALVGVFQAWAFVRSERAFLTVDSGDTGDVSAAEILAGHPFTVTLVVKNSGHSFAVVKYMDIYANVYKTLPDKPLYGAHSAKRAQPIAGEGRWNSTTNSMNVSAKQVNELKAGSKVYVFGRVIYSDEFSIWRTWTTGFCLILNQRGNPKTSVFDTCSSPKYTFAD